MFLTLDQNNSGGYFIQNEDVDEYVIIECDTVKEAKDIFKSLDSHEHEWCQCCGERWSFFMVDDTDLTETPTIYGTPVDKYKKGYGDKSKAIVHYKNGKKRKFNLKHIDQTKYV